MGTIWRAISRDGATQCRVTMDIECGMIDMGLRTASIVAALGLAVAGCAETSTDGTTGSVTAGAGPYPTEYRKIAREFVLTRFRDPYSIRDAQIAPPTLAMGPSLLGNGVLATPWIICVRANAKNAFGAYTGQRETAIQVYQGRGVGSWDRAVGDGDPFWPCRSAKWEPFQEVMS